VVRGARVSFSIWVGGETRSRSFQIIRRGSILVCVVSGAPPDPNSPLGVRSVFFLVEVTTPRLEKLTALFDRGELKARVEQASSSVRHARRTRCSVVHRTKAARSFWVSPI